MFKIVQIEEKVLEKRVKGGDYNKEKNYQVLLRAQVESDNHNFQWNKSMLLFSLTVCSSLEVERE